MASMREIKSRITATKKTAQITKAMHMVSASKLKKAEGIIKSYRPLVYKLREMIDNLLDSDDALSHPMLVEREKQVICYVLVTSDRGLAGPYNSSVFKAFTAFVEENHQSNDEFLVATIGFKAYSFAKRMKYNMLNEEIINVRDDIQFIDFKTVIDLFTKKFMNGHVDSIVVFYNHFINIMTQNVEHVQILPITNGHKEEVKTEDKKDLKLIYNFEPSPQVIIDHLLPMYVENTLYGMILEAKASEHASRMTAMKSATDNAEDVIHTLQLHYNRARQAAITIELTDIIGGANAVN
jgi:F-type H+-transporting ATPase subunit gamma